VGITEKNEVSGITLFPNPADDMLAIGFEPATGAVQVDVLDLTGRVVVSRGANAGTGRMDLDVSDLAAGGYSLRVQLAGSISVQRLVVR